MNVIMLSPYFFSLPESPSSVILQDVCNVAVTTNACATVFHVSFLGLQAFVGGQPLVINGVAQPIVTIYTFMYSFAKSR